MGLLKRLKAKRAVKREQAHIKKMSPAQLEKMRRQHLGNDTYEKLFGEGNAYDGAQQIIARGKANGTYFSDVDPNAKREAKLARQKFRLNRKQTKKRIAQLERRLNGSAGVEVDGSKSPNQSPRSNDMAKKQSKTKRTTTRRDPSTKYKYNEAYLVRAGTMMETMVVIAKRLKKFTRDELVKATAIKGALVSEQRAKSFINWSLSHDVFVEVK